jgi:hypothetical protein
MCCAATAAAPIRSPTTPAATGTARSARAARPSAGWMPARPICCRWSTTTWSSRCRRPSPTSRTRTRRRCTACCSTSPPRRCCDHRGRPQAPGRRIGATLVLHTWGSALTHHPHVHGIVPGGGLAPDGSPGWPAGRGSSCRCACCRGCSGAASWRNCSGCTRRQAAGSSASTRRWPTPGVQGLAGAAAQVRVGGLRQAAVRRAAGGAGLPVALHAPGGHLQQPAARDGRARRHLPLEGLPGQGQARATRPMTLEPAGVHAPLPAACAARRLPPDPALRAAGQRQPVCSGATHCCMPCAPTWRAETGTGPQGPAAVLPLAAARAARSAAMKGL